MRLDKWLKVSRLIKRRAVANEAFRLSLLYGLDLTKFWARTNFINPASCENVAYTMTEMMYYPDGRDYVQAVFIQGLPSASRACAAAEGNQEHHCQKYHCQECSFRLFHFRFLSGIFQACKTL